MKDLIIINSYTPDYEREELLRSFINQIDKTNFDLMVVSHSRLPDDLYEKIEFFVFDKENEILTDLDSRIHCYWNTPNFQISTTEARGFNHSLAAYKLFYVGINNAKNLGYEKAHVIEYDTSLKDMSHFEDNSKLLDEYSLVCYRRPEGHTPVLISFPMSFNLDKINKEWFDFQKEKVIKGPYKTIEDWELTMVNNQPFTYWRRDETLKDGTININLYASFGKDIWICPVIDKDDNCILFVNNIQENSLHVEVIINGEIIKFSNTQPHHWGLLSLAKYEEINSLLIIKDHKEITRYNFEEINREAYKSHNTFRSNN
jgi:hypothetical protein